MDFLIEICRHSSPSRHEEELVEWLSEYIRTNIPDTTVVVDKLNNIYVTKGTAETYCGIVCHTDMVQKACDTKEIMVAGDIIFGYDPVGKEQVGLGFDDKTGIYVAVEMLRKHPAVKAAFFVGEEIGCVGSHAADMDFFENCRFVVQCDRRGNSDFINCAGGTQLCSKDFEKAVNYEAYGFKATTGLMTDVKQLKENGLKVSCCNISCGYYNPHSSKECQSISDLKKVMALVDHIFTDCTEVYPHEKPAYNSYGYGYNYHHGYSPSKGTYAGGKNYYAEEDDYCYGYSGNLPFSDTPAIDENTFTLEELAVFAQQYLINTQYPSELGFIYDMGICNNVSAAFKEKLRKVYNKELEKLK